MGQAVMIKNGSVGVGISAGTFIIAVGRGSYYTSVIETKSRKTAIIYAARRYGETTCYLQGSKDGTNWTDISVGCYFTMQRTEVNVSAYKYLRGRIYYGHDDRPSDGYAFIIVTI